MAETQVRPNSGNDKPEGYWVGYEDARREMAEDIEKFIIEPFGLAAGALSLADDNLDPEILGKFLGLLTRGARAELEIHREGGYGAKAIRDLFSWGRQQSVKTHNNR